MATEKASSSTKFTTPRDVQAEKPAKVTSRVYGAIDTLKDALSIQETNDEETLLDIKVHNPLKRIAKILEDIKKHQATTVSLRFTIPLIALPVVLFVVFQIGRAQSMCMQNFTTQQGRVQVLQLKVPSKSQNVVSLLLSFFPSVPKPSEEVVDEERAMLLTDDGKVLHIVHGKNVDITAYKGQRVLLSGNYSACMQTMALDHESNVIDVGSE